MTKEMNPARNLVWQDEFNIPEIDLSKWRVDVGYTGMANGELEIYTNRLANVYIDNSCLVIVARQEDYEGFRYTSARLTTQGLHDWKFGKIEARIKIPTGKGIWPALWMLGSRYDSVGWPDCGEIDIMENIGSIPDTIRSTIHGPGYCRDDGLYADFTLPTQKFADDFHLFAVTWEKGKISWYVDGICFNNLTFSDVPGEWVFDHPFYLLLNLAVGGHWPGNPDEAINFPQFMYVDYVRVYSREKE